MLNMFCQSAQFRAVVADRSLPPDLDQWYPILDPLIASSYKGALDVASKSMDLSEGSTSLEKTTCLRPLEERELNAFHAASTPLPPQFQECRHLYLRGQIYSPLYDWDADNFQKGRNSSVIYRKKGGAEAPGRIRRILRTETGEGDMKSSDSNTMLLVEQYLPLDGSDVEKDPYRRWPGLNTKLVYSDVEDRLDIISPNDIVAPVARCTFADQEKYGLSKPTVVIVSLDRVSRQATYSVLNRN